MAYPAPLPRTAEPKRRSFRRTVLLRLSGGTLFLGVAAVLAIVTIFSPLGARRAARQIAERELRTELQEGEAIVAQAFVSQRNWYDNFRESFGVIAATDRRLLFVGAPPVSLMRGDDGPPELSVQSFPYDAPYTITSTRLFLGAVPGVRLRTPGGTVRFIVGGGAERERMRAVTGIVERARIARRDAIEQERLISRAPPPPPPVYVTHIVRYGEALSSLARRYRTSTEVLRQLNNLSSDAIRAGQRLRVPQLPEAEDSVRTAPPGPTPSMQ